MTSFPWPDCGKEFETWYKTYSSVASDYMHNALFGSFTEEDMKKIANAAWIAKK